MTLFLWKGSLSMRVGIVGINHKLADLKLRELLAKACQRRFGASCSTHGEHFFVLLSTCNRTEIYFSSIDLAETHTYILNILRAEVEEDFDQKLYSYFGYDCFYHLSRVTAGLDSAILAETEIQGQVKAAYLTATNYTSLPKDLHYLFQKALQSGKWVRSTLSLGRGMPDLEDAILNIGNRHFNHSRQAQVLFIGASDINQKILAFLKSKGMQRIAICNRSYEHAESLADTHGIQILKWEQLSQWRNYEWIICGTKSPDYLIKKEEVRNQQIGHKLIIDLCVPRNIDPRISACPHITLFNIDQINQTLQDRQRKMIHLVDEAERLISRATKNNIDLFYEKEQHRQQFAAI
jgi:glutamyl-tRNA reductase